MNRRKEQHQSEDPDVCQPEYHMVGLERVLKKDYGQMPGFVPYKRNEKYYFNKKEFEIEFGQMPQVNE